MSLIVLAGALALAAGAAGYVASRRERRPLAPSPSTDAPEPRPASRAAPQLERLPLRLGDVVSAEVEVNGRMAHEERWLRGGVVASEGGELVGVVYAAPEGAVLEAVAVFAEPERHILWMSPVEVELGPEPPATLEIGGVLMRRKLRRPVELERIGVGAPPCAAEALWVQYEGPAGAAAVILAQGQRRLAWSGSRLDEGRYDRMGGGADG
mgnify:CR=1 FL=1